MSLSTSSREKQNQLFPSRSDLKCIMFKKKKKKRKKKKKKKKKNKQKQPCFGSFAFPLHVFPAEHISAN